MLQERLLRLPGGTTEAKSLKRNCQDDVVYIRFKHTEVVFDGDAFDDEDTMGSKERGRRMDVDDKRISLPAAAMEAVFKDTLVI